MEKEMGITSMGKSAILFHKDFRISSLKMKNIDQDLNPKKISYVALPILDGLEMQRFLILKANRLITRFESCTIRYQFRIEFFVDDRTDPLILPEVELHPTNIIEFYEALHNLNILQLAFSVMNNDQNYGEYCLVDIHSFEIDIKKSNFGTIHQKFEFDENALSGARYLFADNILQNLSMIYETINDTLSHNERIHILNDEWETTKSLSDDGIYALKLYTNSCVFIDESTYKEYMKLFSNQRNAYLDLVVYDFQDLYMKGLQHKKQIYIDEDSIMWTCMYRIYSPEDLFGAVLYLNQIKRIIHLTEMIIDRVDEDQFGIHCILTIPRNGNLYRVDYGVFPDIHYGNIEIVFPEDPKELDGMIERILIEAKRQDEILRGKEKFI